jgi:hypothetical protein
MHDTHAAAVPDADTFAVSAAVVPAARAATVPATASATASAHADLQAEAAFDRTGLGLPPEIRPRHSPAEPAAGYRQEDRQDGLGALHSCILAGPEGPVSRRQKGSEGDFRAFLFLGRIFPPPERNSRPKSPSAKPGPT